MNWHDYGWPAPPHQADHHTPFLLQLNQTISDLRHSTGRIEARLEHGDTQFKEIRDDLQRIETKVATIEASKPAENPSKIEAAKRIAEIIVPAIKEAWPFIAVAGAASAKALGYDLSGVLGP